jgi:hypothetical protein
MKRLFREWPVLVGVLSGVACAGLFSNLRLLSDDHIRFPHARHLKAKLECVACHDSVYDATDLKDHHLPKEAKCMECHKDKKESGNCAFCHSNPSAIEPRPEREPHLSFDHSKHIDRVNEDCTVCHKVLPEPRRAGEPPKMAACLSCHNHQENFDKGECSLCHKDLWMHPLKPESTFEHSPNFLHEHASAARSDGAACSQCHEQTFCSDCHAKTVGITVEDKEFDRVDRAFVHRGDFISRHATEASANPAMCERCHTTSSCESCHTARNVGAAAQDPRNPHPSGWAFPGSPSFHGDAARTEVETCAVCHDHGGHPDCITCHKVGGIGGNPHPASFLSRHRTVERTPTCLECHL